MSSFAPGSLISSRFEREVLQLSLELGGLKYSGIAIKLRLLSLGDTPFNSARWRMLQKYLATMSDWFAFCYPSDANSYL
jgi:hypothetical protein